MPIRQLQHWLAMQSLKLLSKLMPSSSYMIFSGAGSSAQLGTHIAGSGVDKLLVITDKALVDLGVVDTALSGVKNAGLETVVFDGVLPDPTFDVVQQALAAYRQNGCDSILAIGGGSSIDAAKACAALVNNDTELAKLVGYAKVKAELPPFFAIPTTAGTGSEATIGAVITDSTSHEKLLVIDPKLLPLASALDPSLMLGLPASITAATGMDALTHGIEACIGTFDVPSARQSGRKAVVMVFDHLRQACTAGDDLDVRQAMATASFNAGVAINQVNVGNVHAIAHQLGAKYHIPHGLANAIVLPHVLEFSLPKAAPALAKLAADINVADTSGNDLANAHLFIDAVRQLSTDVGIPEKCDAIQSADIPDLVKAAVKESFSYPVPSLMSESDCQQILQGITV